MNSYVDFEAIARLFQAAREDGRNHLFEYEVYDLIRLAGAETPPRFFLLPKGSRVDPEPLEALPGDQVVLKVVSPHITHKSDVKGVRIVPKERDKVLSAFRAMMVEVPEAYAAMIEKDRLHAPGIYRDLSGEALLNAVSTHIKGALLCQYLPPSSQEFGNELIVSLRFTREFGMVISAGLGGTDTELYAATFRKGQAMVAASTEMTDGDQFFGLYKNTISYKKLAGRTRNRKRLVADDQLRECFSAFIALGNHFSPLNPKSLFMIEELEINPFAFNDYLMFPLDGVCRFSFPENRPAPRPLEKIHRLLHPESIGIIGVSSRETNIGRTILNNVLANGFDPERIVVIHPQAGRIGSIRAVPALEAVGEKLDLLILAVRADRAVEVVEKIIELDAAESVILIPGGLGEKKGGQDKSRKILDQIQAGHDREGGGPVFLGSNCLGILSHPGKYDSLFVPDAKLPKNRGDHERESVFISQSGAYMITRMSKMAFLDPAYAISLGNQMDLRAGDILNYFIGRDEIKIVASYMEGFQDLDGLNFARAVRKAVIQGKEVLFYKAGRTPEGRSATSGHTASLAGDYMVCESCMRQAGAMVAATFTGFECLFRLSKGFHRKTVSGNRLAAVTNAGYEAVGIADNILGEDYKLRMARLSPHTRERLEEVLASAELGGLVDVQNPMDLTPMASEAVYESVTRALLEDPEVDAVVVAVIPMTPLMQTLPQGIIPNESLDSEDGIVLRISRLFKSCDKPLIVVVDSGPLYDPLADAFQNQGLPVFRSADQAVWILGKYIQGRLAACHIRDDCGAGVMEEQDRKNE
jgi:acyl-CoA synthetase (NDP forming)